MPRSKSYWRLLKEQKAHTSQFYMQSKTSHKFCPVRDTMFIAYISEITKTIKATFCTTHCLINVLSKTATNKKKFIFPIFYPPGYTVYNVKYNRINKDQVRRASYIM